MTRGFAGNGARDSNALLLSARHIARVRFEAMPKSDLLQGALRPQARFRAALAAHIERQAHIFFRRQGREQIVRLENEADVLAAQIGELLGLRPVVECPATVSVPDVGVRMQPRIDSSVVLPEPDGPMSKVSSPGRSPADTPFSARTICRPRESLSSHDDSPLRRFSATVVCLGVIC